MKTHQYHLVNPSPWPFIASLSVFLLCIGAVLSFAEIHLGRILMPLGLSGIFFTMFVWWRDIINESAIDKAHTAPVQKGLKMGMLFFILSEVMFFFAFFFAFFHSSLFPVDILGDAGLWPIKAGIWPPVEIKPLNPWSIPFMNTLILLLSGSTVTWAHYALLNKKNKELVQALTYTVALGALFSAFQVYEYVHALHHNFTFKQDVYTANFFMATGFHGFHVIIGTIFLAVCLIRAKKGQFTEENHLGFEFAAWYWHFVDVVWLFLFVAIYVFGS